VDELNMAIEQYQHIRSFFEDILVSADDFFGKLDQIEEKLGADLDVYNYGLTCLGDDWAQDLKRGLTATVDAFVTQTKDHSRDGLGNENKKAA
jgi:hypothetical protein